ncbi:hypothetical protein [Candidatus Pelagibacter sp.]|uniref:hypothetical protein n=1 Tax=Candidatus Pelagibacter sp. TaxID=2024849 RepID=UPI003F842D08
MKQLIFIFFLFILLQEKSYSNNLPDELFGIKLYENVENYIDKSKGKESKYRKGIINFPPKNVSAIKSLVKNDNLDHYYIRTDSDYKILNITGFSKLETMNIDDFKNNCKISADNFKDLLSNFYNINSRKFKTKHYKNYTDYLVLNRTYELIFNKNYNKYHLQINCAYSNRDQKIYSNLFITLMDNRYFEEHTLKLWQEIDPFDDKMITTNLKGF